MYAYFLFPPTNHHFQKSHQNNTFILSFAHELSRILVLSQGWNLELFLTICASCKKEGYFFSPCHANLSMHRTSIALLQTSQPEKLIALMGITLRAILLDSWPYAMSAKNSICYSRVSV